MYANKRKLHNLRRPQLVVSDVRATRYFFKNAACRREALEKIEAKDHPRNAQDTTALVRDKRIAMKLVEPVTIKVATFIRTPNRPRSLRKLESLVLGIK